MKIVSIQFCILSVLFLVLSSCSERKSQQISFFSVTNEIKLHIRGEKPNSLDPWKVNISIDCFGKKDSLGLEIFASDLNKNTVHCTWTGKDECLLKFDQQDNTSRSFMIKSNEGLCSFRELENGE